TEGDLDGAGPQARSGIGHLDFGDFQLALGDDVFEALIEIEGNRLVDFAEDDLPAALEIAVAHAAVFDHEGLECDCGGTFDGRGRVLGDGGIGSRAAYAFQIVAPVTGDLIEDFRSRELDFVDHRGKLQQGQEIDGEAQLAELDAGLGGKARGVRDIDLAHGKPEVGEKSDGHFFDGDRAVKGSGSVLGYQRLDLLRGKGDFDGEIGAQAQDQHEHYAGEDDAFQDLHDRNSFVE